MCTLDRRSRACSRVCARRFKAANFGLIGAHRFLERHGLASYLLAGDTGYPLLKTLATFGVSLDSIKGTGRLVRPKEEQVTDYKPHEAHDHQRRGIITCDAFMPPGLLASSHSPTTKRFESPGP